MKKDASSIAKNAPASGRFAPAGPANKKKLLLLLLENQVNLLQPRKKCSRCSSGFRKSFPLCVFAPVAPVIFRKVFRTAFCDLLPPLTERSFRHSGAKRRSVLCSIFLLFLYLLPCSSSLYNNIMSYINIVPHVNTTLVYVTCARGSRGASAVCLQTGGDTHDL